MIEDLSGNIRRVCEGLAREIATRASGDIESYRGDESAHVAVGKIVRAHAMAVLLDWFLGEFIPGSGGPRKGNDDG